MHLTADANAGHLAPVKALQKEGNPSHTARRQSSGFCWLQPGLGNSRGYALEHTFRICPASFISSSFTAEVPKSIPMYNMDDLIFPVSQPKPPQRYRLGLRYTIFVTILISPL